MNKKTLALIGLVALLATAAVLFQFLGNNANAVQAQQLRKVQTKDALVYYEGSIIVSGVYHKKLRESEIGNFEAGRICFDVRGPSAKLIPRENDSRSPWFCFSNPSEASSAFKIPSSAPDSMCRIVGTATIQISKYVVNKAESEVHDTAHLDKVISATAPTFKPECSL